MAETIAAISGARARAGGGRRACGRLRLRAACGRRRRLRGRGRRLLRLGGRVDPASVHTAVQGLGDLGIDLGAEAGQTAERGLDVAAGAAETVVQIEVAEGGIEVIP